MRIAYVCYVRAFAPDGVNRKIAAQVAWWRAAGHEVELLALTERPVDGTGTPRLPARVFTFASLVERTRATIAVARAIRRLEPDVVYLRYDRYIPPLAPLVWPRRIAVEINTDDTLETVFWGRARWLYNELNRRLTLPLATGLVCVTHELASARSFARFRKPTIVVANGGDASQVEELPQRSGERPAAVMLVGSIGPWVGIDKAVDLARAVPELDVHIVGCRVEDLGTPPPANVRVHGLLTREGYRPLLEGADFGIGPLAVHRKGMDEASPLKVREYLLHGLPVLTAHDDTDFRHESPWFLKRVANTEESINGDLPEVLAWIRGIRGRRVPRAEVVPRVGIDAKETARLTFLAALAGRPTAAGSARS